MESPLSGYDARVLAPVLQMYAFSPPLEHARHDPVVQATYLDHSFAHIEWLQRHTVRTSPSKPDNNKQAAKNIPSWKQ